MQNLVGKPEYLNRNHHSNGALPQLSNLHERISDIGRTGNHVLASLPTRTFVRLQPHFRSVKLEKEDFLYLHGDKIEAVWFPESAAVSEFGMTDDGRMIEIMSTGNEGVVGIISTFATARAANHVQVCIPGTAIRIETTFLERELEASPVLRLILNEHVSRQLKDLSRNIICNTFHSAEQRFSAWLLRMDDRYHDRRFRLTHEELARVLGVHRPSVTHIAQSLRDRGLIEYSRGKVWITDHLGLQEAACLCFSELCFRSAIRFGDQAAEERLHAA